MRQSDVDDINRKLPPRRPSPHPPSSMWAFGNRSSETPAQTHRSTLAPAAVHRAPETAGAEAAERLEGTLGYNLRHGCVELPSIRAAKRRRTDLLLRWFEARREHAFLVEDVFRPVLHLRVVHHQ